MFSMEIAMHSVIEFVQSLSLTGYILIGICVLLLLNLRKLITLRSPLDSWQHTLWKRTGGAGERPAHLESDRDRSRRS